MQKIWGKFVLWSIGILAVIVIRYWIKDVPQETLKKITQHPAFFMGELMGLALMGFVIGSIIFGVWYTVSGRKRQKKL
jgi:hypothetical protein